MRLKINQQFAKVGLNRVPFKFSVKQKPADFELKQINGELKIDSEPVKVEIDQKKARAALHLKNHKIYSRDIASQGKKSALKAIAQYAKKGDQLADIHKGGKPLVSQAKKAAYDNKCKLTLKWKPGPDIKVKSGRQKIDYKSKDLDGIELESRSNWPQVDFNLGKVEVYQKQRDKLEIRVIDEKV